MNGPPEADSNASCLRSICETIGEDGTDQGQWLGNGGLDEKPLDAVTLESETGKGVGRWEIRSLSMTLCCLANGNVEA